MVGVTTTPTNYITFFTDYASNNARKKFTYYAGSSARILAASLVRVRNGKIKSQRIWPLLQLQTTLYT